MARVSFSSAVEHTTKHEERRDEAGERATVDQHTGPLIGHAGGGTCGKLLSGWGSFARLDARSLMMRNLVSSEPKNEGKDRKMEIDKGLEIA